MQIIAIIILAAASRLALSHFNIHPGIISPIVGMSIFAGCYIKRWGSVITVGSLLASDYFLGFYDWKLMSAVYGSVLLAYGIGKIFKSKHIILSAIVSTLLFFFITNFSVWLFTNWYPHTQEGLIMCFTMAIPYLKIGLVNNLAFTVLFFGSYALTKKSYAYCNNSA